MVDIVVVGGGLGGLCAALMAAERGRSVLLVEASSQLGGTALYSGGAIHIWGAESWEDYRVHCPTAPELARVVVDNFGTFVEWLVASGARGRYAATTFRGITIPKYQIGDSILPAAKIAWFAHLGRRLERLGGEILLDSRACELLREDGAVVGVWLERAGERMRVDATRVILAGGGFQRDRELLRRYVGPMAGESVARAVPAVVGDALRMGLEAGAALTPSMGTVYGHLMPAPPCEVRWSNYLDPMLLTAYYAGHGIVVNDAGERFTDESAGELTGEAINDAVGQQAGALWVILDEAIRREHAIYDLPAGSMRLQNLRYRSFVRYFRVRRRGARLQMSIDALRLAEARGATVVRADTVDQLATKLAADGLDGQALVRTIVDYNDAAAAGRAAELTVARSGSAAPLVNPPYSAIKVAPGVSMTYGGVAIDSRARVLGRDGMPIRGLYAVPGAAGGVHDRFYGGALASCGVFGMIAGAEAAL